MFGSLLGLEWAPETSHVTFQSPTNSSLAAKRTHTHAQETTLLQPALLDTKHPDSSKLICKALHYETTYLFPKHFSRPDDPLKFIYLLSHYWK
eukprot:1503217-Amphidinium_carterae.1